MTKPNKIQPNSETDSQNSELDPPNFDEQIEIENPDSQNEHSANLDVIGDRLIGAMPDVQEHAIEQAALQNETILNQYSHLVDKNGAPFDPTIHKTKRDGTPTVSKTGKLMLKPSTTDKHTAKAAGEEQRKNQANVENSTKIELTDVEKQQCVALGKISANALFAAGRMLGGEEWTPRKQQGYDEAAALEQAFADYYISTGKTEISPRAALSVAVLSYALPRFTMPVTQQKSAGFLKKVHAWWHKRKGAKEEKARLKAEQVRKDSEKKEFTIEV